MKKLLSWFTDQPRTHQLVYAAALVVLLLIITNIIFTGYVFLESLKHGVSIHAQPTSHVIHAELNGSVVSSFQLGVQNAPFCSARCEYSVIDVSSHTTLAQGSHTFTASQPIEIGFETTTPNQLLSTPIQLQATCVNQQTRFCQQTNTSQHTVASSIVRTQYTQEQQEAKTTLARLLSGYQQHTSSQLGLLRQIQEINDTRITQLNTQARTQQQAVESQYTQVQHTVDNHLFIQATQLINTPTLTNSIDSYRQLRAAEQQAIQTYQRITDTDLSAALTVANTTQQQQLSGVLREAQQQIAEFYQRNPDEINQTLHALYNHTHAIITQYNSTYQQQATQFSRAVYQDLQMTCVLKNTTCLTQPPTTNTLHNALRQIAWSCQESENMSETFMQAQESFAKQLQSNMTLAQTLTHYNISSIRNSQNFSQLNQDMLVDARNNTLYTTNNTLRLAAQLQASNITTTLNSTLCPIQLRNTTLQTRQLTPTLPALTQTTQSLPTITFPTRQQCNHRGCIQPNSTQREVIVFIHGHSFAQETSPENSMHAFDDIARALQETTNTYYIGKIFAQQPTNNTYTDIQTPMSVSTTYYYNTYVQEGEMHAIAQKNYNLETYALRLKEALDSIRSETNATQLHLVAHSMGGLVARSYLQVFNPKDIASLLQIATPNQGITGRVAQLCPVFGGQLACQDMTKGSVFLQKLPPTPQIPTHTIAGVGCSGYDDGVVNEQQVRLAHTPHTNITGNCSSTQELLHTEILNPDKYPQVLRIIQNNTGIRQE